MGLISPTNELDDRSIDVQREVREGCPVRIRTDADDDLRRDARGEDAGTGQFTQPTLELVAQHRGVAEPRNDQPDSSSESRRRHERGSDGPNLEMSGSETLPLLRDTLQFRASRDPCTPRKA
jgi:hypothetical protein